MKKAILLNSYVGDQLRTLVTSDYSWSVSTTGHKMTKQKMSSNNKEVKKKTTSK